jgi:Polyketide cyclase / dehydrase and lipid transport
VVIEADGDATILRPVEDVFDYPADPCNEPEWLPGAGSVKQTSDGELGLGSAFVGEYDRAGRIALSIVEFERPSCVTFRARSRIMHFDDAVHLTAIEGGTGLVARMTAEPQGLMRILAPVIGRTLRRQFASN